MAQLSTLVSKIAVLSVGAVTSVVAHKLLRVGWKLVTGKKPPSPTDSKTHWLWWISWALSGAVGTVASQLAAERIAVRRLRSVPSSSLE